MPIEAPGIRMSTLDSTHFGFAVARADAITAEEIPGALEFCTRLNVRLLIVRCAVEQVTTVHALEHAGFELMDTLVYYERDLVARPISKPRSRPIRRLQPDEADQVEQIARICFRHYSGHYHADKRLAGDTSTEVYAKWARSCCDINDPSAFVLVASNGPALVAFSSFRRQTSKRGELILGAVLPAARGEGLYRKFVEAGMFRLQSSGVSTFETSTHLSNWPAQVAWISAGLRPSRAYHTFHRWFTQDA
jgi:hypothetical protein